MRRAPFILVCDAVIAMAVLGGCGSPAPEPDGSTSSAMRGPTQGPPIVVIPPPPPIYNAYVGELGCVPVQTATGWWFGDPTFPGDPSFCTYEWEGARPGPPAGSLVDGLVARGVLASDITIDASCTHSSCAHPFVAEVREEDFVIGGSVNCVKCVHGSVVATVGSPINGSNATLHVALAPSQVTAGPSRLVAVVDNASVSFDQPGGVAAFSVGLTTFSGDTSHWAMVPGPGGGLRRWGDTSP